MKQKCFVVVIVLALVSAHRLPAPIVEEAAKPKPAKAESETPKRKQSSKSKTKSSTDEASTKSEAHTAATPSRPAALEGPARFAGLWSGKISQGLLGHQQTSLTVDPTATSIELNRNLGGGSKPLTTNGNTISWHSGVLGEIAWTLTSNADGRTAQVTMQGLLVHDSATFSRGQSSAAAERSTSTPQASPPNARSTSTQVSAAGGSMNGPRPEYSQAARNAHLTGTGTYLLHFDTATGNVTDVSVTQSAGSTVLDQAAINAFRQWHAQPNGPKEFPLTISFP